MKVAIDARESGTSTGRYVDKLVEYLAKLDTDLDFIILTKSHRVQYLKSIAPSFKVIPANMKEFSFKEQFSFKELLKALDVDLVHFGMVQQPILYKGKVVTTIQDLTTLRFNNPSKNYFIFKFKQLIYRLVVFVAIKKSALVITPSSYVKEDLMRFSKSKAKKFRVSYYSADKIKDRKESIGYLNKKDFILYVGRPNPHKNLEGLIKAFEILKETQPNLCLVLAGKKDINYQKIEDMVNLLGLKDVYFTGFVSDGQLRWLYENTKAYVFPSFSEGFGLPSLEAMAHSAPVISSNATCLPEINGDGALYFNPNNIKEMSQKIESVITDKKLRNELIKKGRDQLKKYSWQKTAKETLNVYLSVLEP